MRMLPGRPISVELFSGSAKVEPALNGSLGKALKGRLRVRVNVFLGSVATCVHAFAIKDNTQRLIEEIPNTLPRGSCFIHDLPAPGIYPSNCFFFLEKEVNANGYSTGGLDLYEVALITQSTEYFLTIHKTPLACYCGIDGKVACFDPVVLRDPMEWPSLMKFFDRVFGADVSNLASFMSRQENVLSSDLAHSEGYVKAHSPALGAAWLITNNGDVLAETSSKIYTSASSKPIGFVPGSRVSFQYLNGMKSGSPEFKRFGSRAMGID